MKLSKFTFITITGVVLCTILVSIYYNKKATPEKAKKISGAFHALNLWADQRSYPNNSIPDDGYYQAFEYSQSQLHSVPNSITRETAWEPIGPHNIGGRTLAVAFNPQNPNSIYAGSASGGLWRSYTGGTGYPAWEQIHTGFPVLSVSGIAISPTDSNTIFISTGEVYAYQDAHWGVADRLTRGSYGIGILKSIDGGETWEKSLDWSYNQRRGVQVLKMNPQNSATLWAGTTEGTYKSVDAGLTWEVINSTIMVTDLVINPIDTNIVFISCGNLGSDGRGIYRTVNGGETWEYVNNGLPDYWGGKAMLAISESNPDILFTSIGNSYGADNATWLCRSDNNGDSWSIVNTFDYSLWQGWYSHFVGIHPTNENEIIVGGIEIWKSNDGGSNLTQKSWWDSWYFGQTEPGEPEGPPYYVHADIHVMVNHPENPDIIYFGTDGGVFKSMNWGQSFEGCNGGYQTTQFYPGFSSSVNDSNLAMGGMQDNSTAIYDGTFAWRRVIGGDGSWTAINPLNENILYGSTQYLNVLRSSDFGNYWNNISPSNIGYPSFIAPYILCRDNPEILFAGRSYIFKSTNEGNDWVTVNGGNQLDGNPALTMNISDNDCNIIYVTTAPLFSRGRVFLSVNGGTTWQNITSNLPDRYPMDIALNPENALEPYIAISGFGSSHLFKYDYMNYTWIDIGANLPDVPTSAVTIDPDYSSHIYVGNDLGIFVSLDDGENWYNYNDGIGDATMVMDLSISTINRTLRAVTHGNGVFERKLIDIEEFVLGDVNLDGVVDILDVIHTVNIILGLNTNPSTYELWASDLNQDGTIDILDIVHLVNTILG